MRSQLDRRLDGLCQMASRFAYGVGAGTSGIMQSAVLHLVETLWVFARESPSVCVLLGLGCPIFRSVSSWIRSALPVGI